jgi:FkbM family methyltransferase
MLARLKTVFLDKARLEVVKGGTLANFFATRPIDLVIDAGANLGQFAQSIRRKGYWGQIVSFEPVGYVYEALAKNAQDDELWEARKLALGNAPGLAEINVFGNHTLSSFLGATEHLQAYDTSAAPRTESVEIRTIDSEMATSPAKHIFLKADVQGLERQVIEGASETLKRTVGVYLELPISSLYEGSWTFREAINFMDDLGFEPAQFRMVSAKADDPAAAVEFDTLFCRKTP